MPLAPGSCVGRLRPPRVRTPGDARAHSLPSSRRCGPDLGAGEARGQKPGTPGPRSVPSRPPELGCLGTLQRFCGDSAPLSAFPHPTQTSLQARQQAAATPSRDPPFRGRCRRRRHARVSPPGELLLHAVLSRLSPGPLLPRPCPAERCGKQRSRQGSGQRAPTPQQVEPRGCPRPRLHPVPRLSAAAAAPRASLLSSHPPGPQ